MSYKNEEEKEGGDLAEEKDFDGEDADDFDPMVDDLDLEDDKVFGGFGDDNEDGY